MGLFKGLMKFAPAALTLAAPFLGPAAPFAAAAGGALGAAGAAGGQPQAAPAPMKPITDDIVPDQPQQHGPPPGMGTPQMPGGQPPGVDLQSANYKSMLQPHNGTAGGFLGGLGGLALQHLLKHRGG